jgi:hypothetical protein
MNFKWGPVFNGVYGDEWPVSGTPTSVELFVDWEDQGWGSTSANVRLARHNPDTDTETFLWLASMQKHGRHKIEFAFKPTYGDEFGTEFWQSPLAEGEVYKIWWDTGGQGHTLTFHRLAITVHQEN